MLPRSRTYRLLAFFASVLLITYFASNTRLGHRHILRRRPTQDVEYTIHRHIAICTSSPLHSDVEGALAWQIRNVFNRMPSMDTSVKIYAHGDVVEGSWLLYARDIGLLQNIEIVSAPLELERDLRSVTLFPKDIGSMVDMVVLGTCETDMHTWSAKLLAIWDKRPINQKFKLVCFAHNPAENDWWPLVSEWSRRGSFRFLLISDHVTNAFRSAFRTKADSPTEASNPSFWEFLEFDTYYPIANFTDRPFRRKTNGKLDVVNDIALQGTFDTLRRDYSKLFSDLQRLLKDNSRVWGYLPLPTSGGVYEPDSRSPWPPFKVHLVGQGKFDYPNELHNIVVIHGNLDAKGFYDVIQSMDLMVPAFAQFGRYIDDQASSTIHTALECNIPVLVTKAMRHSYQHIDDDAVVITRPHVMAEMDAIRLLRTQELQKAQPPPRDGPPQYAESLQEMLAAGWKRPNDGFNLQKRRIWAENDAVVRKLLAEA